MDLKFDAPLVKATLVRRYKRFMCDAILEDGSEVVAHCPNTGSMKTCGEKGDSIYLSYNPSPKRKLKYSWELTETPHGFVGINTMRPNHIVEEGIKTNLVKELQGYETIKREVKFKDSRFDIFLDDPQKGPCWVEIKNVTLLENKKVIFPDAVTTRGLKHLQHLEELAQKNDRAIIFYLVNRTDGLSFSPAEAIDPDYAKALRRAYKKGVEVLAYRSHITLDGISLGEPVQVVL